MLVNQHFINTSIGQSWNILSILADFSSGPGQAAAYAGHRLVDQQGFTYRKDRSQSNSTTWRCTLEWKHKCKARAKTMDNVIVRISTCHNHEPQIPEQALQFYK